MVGTTRSIEITKVSYQVQSTNACLFYQRLGVSCTLCNDFQAARPRQTTERRLAPLYDKSYVYVVIISHNGGMQIPSIPILVSVLFLSLHL